MFDTGSYKISDAIENSQDYKLVRVDGWLYVFPTGTDFSELNHSRHSSVLDRQAVLIITPLGLVKRNRFGSTGT